MRKKKVLLFHPALAPYLIDQFNWLKKMFDFELVFLNDNLWDHKFNQSTLLSQLECNYSFLLKGIQLKWRVFRFGVYKTIKSSQPDIIFSYEFSFTTLYLIFLKRLVIIHQPIGSFIDDSFDMCNNEKSIIRKFIRKYSVKHLNYFVLQTQDVARYYHDTFSVPYTKTILFPILQDEKRLKKDSKQLEHIAKEYFDKYSIKGKRVLLFIGRFVSVKALARFIYNISPILQKENDLLCVLVGEGLERQRIDDVVKMNSLEEKVIFPGRFENNHLYAWYLCASAFFLPSIHEPFGAVIIEALIFGLKVFCSQYAGASSLIGTNGILFNPLNDNETREKISEFIESIPPVKTFLLEDHKSLMFDHESYFEKEWSKVR